MSDILICSHTHRTGVLDFVEKKKVEWQKKEEEKHMCVNECMCVYYVWGATLEGKYVCV